MAEVKITYETLFDLLRREKSRNELQQLDDTFYHDVIAYLKEKKGTIRDEGNHPLLFSRGEQEKIKIQIGNIQKILRELYELREKKIINLAINKVKTESNLIDTSNLLPEETNFFNDSCRLLSRYREGILHHVILMESPEISELGDSSNKYFSQEKIDSETREKYKQEIKQENEDLASVRAKEKESIFDSNPSRQQASEKDYSTGNDRLVKVRILNDLPKFMGQDKKIYGPYAKQAETELPESITNILLKKGRIELL
jgi:DNA replication initiation complex subunit (GINS family)